MLASERYQREVAEMEQRHERRVRVLSFSGAALLIIAALWAAGLPPAAWWTWLQARMLDTPAPVVSTAPQSSATPSSVTVATATPRQALTGTDSSIAPTPQPLYLIATVPGRNINEGTAQIGTSLENPQTYGGGALLANGATLREIHRDHVVLARGRESVRLDLYQPNQPAQAVKHALLLVGGPPAQAPQTSPVFQVAIARYIRPNPVFDGELLRGYEVYPGPKSGVFHQFGLQGGDVITALNDVPFVDADQAMQLFEPLTQGQSMMATVERKGAVQRIALDGALIAADAARAQEATAQAAAPPGMPPG